MGPSLVLLSIGSMAAEWNRNSLNSTFNNNGSSNDDDDEEDGGTQRDHSFPVQERVTDSRPPEQGTRPAPPFAVASFRGQFEADSILRREQASTYSYNTRASQQYSNRASVDNTASAQRGTSFSGLDFSMSPLYSSVNVGHYLPLLDDAAENSSTQLESKLEEDEDDDRKPAAIDSPQKVAALERTYGYVETAQTELASPHRKSHSISSDPFHSASTSNIEQQVPSTSHERLIDPSFSFEEEYDVRGFYDGQGIIPNVWDVPEGNDPKFNVHRRRHFTPPHANFAAPYRSAHNDPAPQTIAFRLGDGDPNIDDLPSTRDIRNVVDSIASQRVTRKMLSPRPSQQIAVHQSIRAPVRNVSFRRREASAIELGSAETDRARSAIIVWYRRFNELIDYCEEHGDCNVPQKHAPNPQLGIWVNKQRMEKKFMDENKRTSMTASKVEALESIGFTWAKRKGDASWLYKYHELQTFFEQFGSCDVPTKYAPNPALGRWVSTQRSEYKIFMQTEGRSRHLTQEKIDMLNAIGFKWEMIPSRLSNSSTGSHSNGTSSGSSHNTHTSSQGAFIRSREV